jgi:hypothetical protein
MQGFSSADGAPLYLSGRLVQRVSDRVSPQVSKWDSLASAKGNACLLDATQKFWVMFEPVLEPFLLRRKPDEDAGGTTMSRDDDLFIDRESQILGQVILHLRQCDLLRALALACLLRRATTGLRPS